MSVPGSQPVELHSSNGGHDRQDGPALVNDASHSLLLATGVLANALWFAPALPVLFILDNGDPLTTLAAKR